MPIEDALDTARDQAADFLNAEGGTGPMWRWAWS